MSRYHPIDVRHPSNRAYRKRNFLLDPPARDLETALTPVTQLDGAGTKPRPARTVTARSVSSGTTSAPWGKSQPSTPAAVAEANLNKGRGLAKLLRWIFFIGLFLTLFGRELQDPLYDLWRTIRAALWNAGIPIPF
ncbi:hypothetical protein LCM17_01190 [Cereibacter sphaeroides]|nr:hypothetical protein [Cereibacter sphaeroides]